MILSRDWSVPVLCHIAQYSTASVSWNAPAAVTSHSSHQSVRNILDAHPKWWLEVFFLKWIYFGFPGLPDGLPDAVCPAAMLQHVFRPPQQQRETNAAVHRPLAPPRAPRTRQTCSLLSPHPFHSRYIRRHNQEKIGKLGVMDMAEERTWIRRKWHALICIPRLCSLAGWRN